jgi:hypothetical protein
VARIILSELRHALSTSKVRQHPAAATPARRSLDGKGISMRSLTTLAAALACFACLRAAALGDGGVGIRLLNNTPDSLIVTLVDLNTQPPQRVLSGDIINGNAYLDLSVTPDSSGRGRIAWTTTSVDPDMRRCGHHVRSGIRDGDTIRVHARRRCPGG